MKVKKNGWVDKIAYGFSKKHPENTNLCKLFWRVLFMLFIGWPAFLALAGILLAWGYFMGFLVAKRPDFGPGIDLYTPIEKWPKIGGYRIWPLTLIILWMIVTVVWKCFPPVALTVMAGIEWLFANGFKTAMIFTGIFLVIGLCYAIVKFFKSELWKLARAYISAKKQKICPIVEFVD